MWLKVSGWGITWDPAECPGNICHHTRLQQDARAQVVRSRWCTKFTQMHRPASHTRGAWGVTQHHMCSFLSQKSAWKHLRRFLLRWKHEWLASSFNAKVQLRWVTASRQRSPECVKRNARAHGSTAGRYSALQHYSLQEAIERGSLLPPQIHPLLQPCSMQQSFQSQVHTSRKCHSLSLLKPNFALFLETASDKKNKTVKRKVFKYVRMIISVSIQCGKSQPRLALPIQYQQVNTRYQYQNQETSQG